MEGLKALYTLLPFYLLVIVLLLTCYCNYYCCSNYIIEEVVKTRGDAIERNQRVPGSHDEVEEIILWQ